MVVLIVDMSNTDVERTGIVERSVGKARNIVVLAPSFEFIDEIVHGRKYGREQRIGACWLAQLLRKERSTMLWSQLLMPSPQKRTAC